MNEQAHPHRPHDVNPSLAGARVVLAIKNFSKVPGVCHIGLGVTATNTQKVLRKHGVQCEAWPIDNSKGKGSEFSMLLERLRKDNWPRVVTHVIISAPSWIQPDQFNLLALEFPNIMFVQLNHSGCAYLSIDKFGIRNIRGVAALQEMLHNVRVAGNNIRFCRAIDKMLGINSLLLPNLYDTDSFVHQKAQHFGNTLRIGSFGASRPWKNQLCAAEGAVFLARSMGRNLEFYVNSKRPDGGERMIESRQELFDRLPGARIHYVPWASWPTFRDISANMHLLIQPSFDETFNVCTMDGIAEGVPSVTTSAIEWTPEAWWCKPEDPESIALVGMTLLNNPEHHIHHARTLARQYSQIALHRWQDFVLGKNQIPY